LGASQARAAGTDFVTAALEPHRWLEALGHLADATGSDHAQLIGFGPGYSIGFNWASNAPAEMSSAFAPVPPDINFRVAAARVFPHLPIVYEKHYAAVVDGLRSNEYVEMCRDWGISHGCQTNLREKPDGLVGMALLRSERNGRTRPADREIFDRARREAAAAVALQIALEQDGYRLIAGTFDAMASACFVMDRGLRVRAMSPQAEGLLSDRSLRLEDGFLKAVAPGEALNAALRAIRGGTTSARQVILASPPPALPLSLHIHRLPAREWAMGFAPFAVAVATRPDLSPAPDGASIRTAFGLTAAETDIALQLAAGASRDEMRDARGISHETLRSHLRALYTKLGVRREAAAVHLLGRLIR
jgi:DNA-binding CsgD family transcriptional regulator